MDIRKFGIAIAVAIVTAIFIYAVADAVAPASPDYSSCYPNQPVRYEPYKEGACNTPVFSDEASKACAADKGTYEPTDYNESGCPARYECSYCQRDMQAASEKHNMGVFYTAVVLGIIAIIVGFMLPLGSVHEWVGLGFIIGGVISMFIGTVQYWGDLSRYARPIVIGVELAILLFIVYKRMSGDKPKRKR